MLIRIFQGIMSVAVFVFVLSLVIRLEPGKGDSLYMRYLGGTEEKKAVDRRSRLSYQQKITTERLMETSEATRFGHDELMSGRLQTLTMIEEQRTSLSSSKVSALRNDQAGGLMRMQKERVRDTQDRYRDLMASRQNLIK